MQDIQERWETLDIFDEGNATSRNSGMSIQQSSRAAGRFVRFFGLVLFSFLAQDLQEGFLKASVLQIATSPINISTSSDICPHLLHQLLLCHQYFSTLGSSCSAWAVWKIHKIPIIQRSEPCICSELNQSLADLPTFNPCGIKSTEISQPLLKQLCLQVAFLGSKVKGAPTIFFNLNHSKLLQRITEFNHFWIFLEEMALKKKKIYYTQCFEIQRSLLHWSQLGLISTVGHNPQSLKKRAKIESTKTNGPRNSWKLQLSVLRILPFWAENLRTSVKYMAKMIKESNPSILVALHGRKAPSQTLEGNSLSWQHDRCHADLASFIGAYTNSAT